MTPVTTAMSHSKYEAQEAPVKVRTCANPPRDITITMTFHPSNKMSTRTLWRIAETEVRLKGPLNALGSVAACPARIIPGLLGLLYNFSSRMTVHHHVVVVVNVNERGPERHLRRLASFSKQLK